METVTMDNYETKLSKAQTALSKRKALLDKSYGKRKASYLIAKEDKLLTTAYLPPRIGVLVDMGTSMNNVLYTAAHRNFNEDEVDTLIDFIHERIYDILLDPKAVDQRKRAAFVRLTCLGYLTEILLDLLIERDVLVLRDKFVQQIKSHRDALEDLITDVQNRAVNTGKVGMTGNNYRQLDELRDMSVGLVRNIWVSEYTDAYRLVYTRTLNNRLGGTMNDWI